MNEGFDFSKVGEFLKGLEDTVYATADCCARIEAMLKKSAADGCKCASQKPEEPKEPQDLASITDRDVLLKICEAETIEVPKGIRTVSLPKLIEDARKARELSGGATPLFKEEDPAAEPQGEPDPFDEPDPFGTDPEPEAPKVTKVELLAACQEYQRLFGTPAIIKLIKDVAGVNAFQQIKEEQYNAVYDVVVGLNATTKK
jgi:cell pole-organizing protein PopZ